MKSITEILNNNEQLKQVIQRYNLSDKDKNIIIEHKKAARLNAFNQHKQDQINRLTQKINQLKNLSTSPNNYLYINRTSLAYYTHQLKYIKSDEYSFLNDLKIKSDISCMFHTEANTKFHGIGSICLVFGICILLMLGTAKVGVYLGVAYIALGFAAMFVESAICSINHALELPFLKNELKDKPEQSIEHGEPVDIYNVTPNQPSEIKKLYKSSTFLDKLSIWAGYKIIERNNDNKLSIMPLNNDLQSEEFGSGVQLIKQTTK